MYRVIPSRQFTRSLRKLKRSGMFKSSAEENFNEAVNTLMAGKILPAPYTDHQLSGEWSAYRECHIKGNVLLVYERRDGLLILVLVDIGSHPYLFG